LLSSDGHRFKCLQGEIEVLSSNTAAEAKAQASTQFARERDLCDWRIYADDIEVMMLDADIDIQLRAAA
jgi:hypothetical protein